MLFYLKTILYSITMANCCIGNVILNFFLLRYFFGFLIWLNFGTLYINRWSSFTFKKNVLQIDERSSRFLLNFLNNFLLVRCFVLCSHHTSPVCVFAWRSIEFCIKIIKTFRLWLLVCYTLLYFTISEVVNNWLMSGKYLTWFLLNNLCHDRSKFPVTKFWFVQFFYLFAVQ